jgi:carbohydrate kinase (thermoresistant glucokinase family)
MSEASPAPASAPAHRVGAPTVAVVMGVSGSGKTTVAALLAAALGWQFQEGDALHPPANVEKMSRGVPLTDEDRWPWLALIAERIDGWLAAGRSGVVTCSALKHAYRRMIVGDRPRVRLVYLQGDRALIHARMAARHEHFMPLALLDSQLATLEEPGPDERPITVAIGGTPSEIVAEIARRLEERDAEGRRAC